MFLSKLKKLLATANFTKIQIIWLTGSFRGQKLSQKPFSPVFNRIKGLECVII